MCDDRDMGGQDLKTIQKPIHHKLLKYWSDCIFFFSNVIQFKIRIQQFINNWKRVWLDRSISGLSKIRVKIIGMIIIVIWLFLLVWIGLN